ncbi:(11Z)-hexadec-11-enoyl-CoA conjugase-like [Belonocnema kinseyi]|uniref:(11Z)-hexadec-11-enoyl-CoA conjugase-like n=1 Tax=Belonocnema kinseyi TaxID=2817044 RepID=UPI00143DAC7C|nr:(11Z)-hexadec-11-enoyl-CoA conjugase-like [Belonocnema kinseyi]XP_033226670.1 (11Z)-hexadec-11-enoyl-CoA conjugase-like [Belonocnema kinseyi]
MAPTLFGSSATLLLEASQHGISQEKKSVPKPELSLSKARSDEKKYKWHVVWRNVIAFVYIHGAAVYGLYLVFTSAKFASFVTAIAIGVLSGVGITAGAHRLWAHRAYKAKWPMRMILMILQTVAFQNHIYEWVRDHRVHHKFTDTDADPHNAGRGFFFSHMGWLLVRKHPDVVKKGATVDMSDLEKDPIILWQKRLYIILMPIFCFLIPTWIPCYFFGEKPINAWYLTLLRYALTLNGTWLVNSAAHIWGNKPFDKTISPTDSLAVGIGAFGEGWHNYHHVFPWDYKAAELGNYKGNITTAFIDMFAWMGQAYDLKTVSVAMVNKRAARTGDGSREPRPEKPDQEEDYEGHHHHHHHHHHDHSHENVVWGWDDKDMAEEDMQDAEIYNKGD